MEGHGSSNGIHQKIIFVKSSAIIKAVGICEFKVKRPSPIKRLFVAILSNSRHVFIYHAWQNHSDSTLPNHSFIHQKPDPNHIFPFRVTRKLHPYVVEMPFLGLLGAFFSISMFERIFN
jgi:hypothetical protein